MECLESWQRQIVKWMYALSLALYIRRGIGLEGLVSYRWVHMPALMRKRNWSPYKKN